MKSLSQLCSFIMTCVFWLFLLSPSFATAWEGSDTVIIHAGFVDTCSWNIQCEVLDSTHYVCHSTDEALSSHANQVQDFPVAKQGIDSNIGRKYIDIYNTGTPREKKILYHGPELSTYPFVRIIKIQV